MAITSNTAEPNITVSGSPILPAAIPANNAPIGMEPKNRSKDERFLAALGLADGAEMSAREALKQSGSNPLVEELDRTVTEIERLAAAQTHG